MMKLLAALIARMNLRTLAGDKLHQAAVWCLGRDVAPRENEYGCAEAVNNVVFKAFGDYAGGDLSTARMYLAIKSHRKFAQVRLPLPGDIILSPTGYGNGSMKNGHAGIVGEGKSVMSNNSANGLFERNYTVESWTEKYVRKGGFPVLFFRRITY